MKKFKEGFLLGAATAAHQVEGNNIHSDYWVQEHLPHTSFVEPSLDAVDHYHLYEQDIKMMAEAGLNAYRFSIEWARIEPECGKFDETEIEHYRKVISCCKENGIEPVVTLLHFSSPAWLIRQGGWEAESTVEYFSRYVRYVMERLGGGLHTVCTINEANMGIQVAAIAKRYMQQAQAMMAKARAAGVEAGDGSVQMGMNLQKMMENQKYAAVENMEAFGTEQPQVFTGGRTGQGDILVMKAHQAAKREIKALYPEMRVGLTLSLHDFQPQTGGEAIAEREWTDELIHYLPYIEGDDFLGVQNYTRTRTDEKGTLPASDDAELTQMNYEFYPQALENVIRKVAAVFHGDLIVTENGIATADDERRVAFIDAATDGVANCIKDGLPVKGYFYWSLMDNFEWQKGYGMTFGLIAVDRKNGQKRTAKPSLAFLGSLC